MVRMADDLRDMIDEELFNTPGRPPERSPFLFVLCILTIFGSTLGLIGSFMGFWIVTILRELGNTGGRDIPGQEETLFLILMTGGNILCLAGAIIMLAAARKIGLYLYIIGETVPAIYFFWL